MKSYRAMDDDAQKQVVVMLDNIAKACPRLVSLRLVRIADVDRVALKPRHGRF